MGADLQVSDPIFQNTDSRRGQGEVQLESRHRPQHYNLITTAPRRPGLGRRL